MRRSMSVVLLLCLLVPILAACGDDGGGDTGTGGGSAESSKPVDIRMGFTIPSMDALYLMKTNPQLFPNTGKEYNLDWFQFAGTGETVQGLATGTLDGAVVGSLTAANAIEKGADLVITGEYLEEKRPWARSAWAVKKDSDIQSVADMSGKSMGVPTGSVLDWLGKAALDKAGVTDAKQVSVQYPTAAAALKEGKVDMALLVEPFLGTALKEGWARVVFDTNDVVDPLVGTLQAFRGDFVKEHPEAVKAFSDDLATAFEYVMDPANRETVIKSTNEVTKIPADVLDAYLLTKKDVYRPERGAINVEALQKNWDFFRGTGAIKQDLQVPDYMNPDVSP